MYNQQSFLITLAAAAQDGKNNFFRKETDRIIENWQAEILAAARQTKKSVDIFLNNSNLGESQKYIEAAALFFTEINLRVLFFHKENVAKSNIHYYVNISWE